ncbi:MAG: sulfatase [Myxococcota bacterium]|nr:sulfatase [Myxococcota bacterium]
MPLRGASTLGSLLALAGVVALGCEVRPGSQPSAQERPGTGSPNVLIVVIDSLRRDRLGVYGHDRPTSPRIDALARSGVLYTAAVSTAPWTTPSVASLLTSRLPSSLGIRAKMALQESAELLPEILGRHGYATAAVISHSYIDAKRNFDQGFEVFDEANVKTPFSATSPGVTDHAVALLRRSRRPFFLFVHYFDPHFPYLEHPGFTMPADDALPAYRGPVSPGLPWRSLRGLAKAGTLTTRDAAELLRIYDSEVAFTDAQVGRLLDALEEEGIVEDTLVVLTSDHGEEFLDHDGVGHTFTLYDELISIPLIVRYPSATRPGLSQPRVDSEPSSLLDVLPTVLDVVGIAPEGPSAGTSLLQRRPADRPLYSETYRGVALRSVSSGGWKLIEDRKAGTRALYDLRDDASESRDLWADPAHAAVRSELEATLERWPAGGRASEGEPIEVSPEERERLRALGYTGD